MIELLIKNAKLNYVKEYRFHPVRKWRFDFAFIDDKIAVEIEGGTWISGRHSRGAGYSKDCEKYNNAVLLGWRVLRYTSDMIQKDPEKIINDVKDLLNG